MPAVAAFVVVAAVAVAAVTVVAVAVVAVVVFAGAVAVVLADFAEKVRIEPMFDLGQCTTSKLYR